VFVCVGVCLCVCVYVFVFVANSNSRSSIKAYGQLSDPFSTNNGVRQGCVLGPALFNLFLDHVVRQALKNINEGTRFTMSPS